MSLFIDQQIFRFEVSIDNILLMHVANGQQNLADVKHSDIVAKTSVFPESIEEFPSGTKLEDHVDKGIVLKGYLQRVDEWMVQLA